MLTVKHGLYDISRLEELELWRVLKKGTVDDFILAPKLREAAGELVIYYDADGHIRTNHNGKMPKK